MPSGQHPLIVIICSSEFQKSCSKAIAAMPWLDISLQRDGNVSSSAHFFIASSATTINTMVESINPCGKACVALRHFSIQAVFNTGRGF
jgi:hypothetical protein